jgi:hypothetical protein
MTTEWTDLQTIGSAFPMDAQSSSPGKPATHRKGISHMPLNSEPRQAELCRIGAGVFAPVLAKHWKSFSLTD